MGLVIENLDESQNDRIELISQFLLPCFQKYSPDWLPNKKAALNLIMSTFGEQRRSRVALGENGHPIGWIGAITDEDVWEIHPIAVSPDNQRKAVGKSLVADVESLARSSGAVAVWAGTSDETASTSFSSIDLYKEPGRSFENIETPEDHPIQFWLKMGYSIVGVMPDEEGLGKPGIHFAKRVV
ncbi:MAG: GNAT family N-acetyltransferase [Pseudomonadales bacterium]|nr:GNAT family N-acetyltransferase [Pseudomonadales bacterium]MBO7007297.1 GNAT family N-acetyltransferase [Pseudomonadales bacterium]